MSILAHSTFVRRNRRKARREVRIMAGNIKRAAAHQGLTNIVTLSKAAGIPLHRVTLMWLGVNMNVVEMTGYMLRLDLSVEDLFAGTGDQDVAA